MANTLHTRRDPGDSFYSPVIPQSLISYILSFKLGIESLLYGPKPKALSEEPKTAWEQVTSEIQHGINRHEKYWWQRSGYALAVLLRNAGYSDAAQVRILGFFARRIANSLGVANEPGAQRWKSFMTDDNTPIELSWDWNTGVQKPTVRFSIEPVGLDAGGPSDPRNERAAAEFKNSVLQALPDTDMSWFDHFEAFFNEGTDRHAVEGHPSKVFWAFDLGEEDLTSKAYFFPGYRARATNATNLQVISEAIAAVPSCTPEKLGAFHAFASYVREHEQSGAAPLELDMLAIDMTARGQSRLKIYFRNRATSFQSVRATMTFNGRVAGPDMDEGLDRLRRLWDALFDREGERDDDEAPLGREDHRTAGILYNVEFRLGGQAPKAKVYVPVRHYARSDAQVVRAVSGFMDSQRAAAAGTLDQTPGEARDSTSAAYAKAFGTIL
ncbi:aromatic prenyltransferase [Hypoxylon cercidicola]|nr:aromatic prenyltransferase [Hypoxylon cercidicola]